MLAKNWTKRHASCLLLILLGVGFSLSNQDWFKRSQALYFLERGQVQTALVLINRLIESNAHGAKNFVTRAEIELRLDDWRACLADLETAGRLGASSQELDETLVQALVRAGRTAEALKLC